MTLRRKAKELLDHHGGDIREAEKDVDRVLSDREIQADLAAFVRHAFLSELRDEYLAGRHAYRTPLAKGQTSDSPSMRHVMAETLKWLDWPVSPLVGRLGDATKQDLDDWCDQKAKRLETEALDLAFVQAIAAELKSPRSTVKGRFQEADLRQVRKLVERRHAKRQAA